MSSKMKELEDEEIFKVGTEVEVTPNEDGFKNSWYKGKIMKPQKSKKNYHLVEYESLVEDDTISKPLMEYVPVSFIRPRPPTLLFNKNHFDKFDVVEASHRDGWWIGAILNVMHVDDGFKYLVGFVSPNEEIEFSKDDLRLHFTWLGGDKWVQPPKKIPMHSPEDGSEAIVASLLESISTQVTVSEKTPSTPKRLKKTRIVAKFKSSPLSSSEGHTNRALQLSDMSSNRSIVLSPNIGSHTLQGQNKQRDGESFKTKRRGRPPKSIVRPFHNVNSLQIGEVLAESRAMQDSDAGKKPEKLGTIQDNANEQRPTGGERGKSDIIHDSVIESSPTTDHAGEEAGESSGPMHHSTIEPSSKTNPDESRSLPFVKISEMWKVIESMEVFKKFPQKPHFSPLNEHEENAREMLAICIMSKFVYETERIIAARSGDTQSIETINASLENFKEMESHGFSTTRFQVYLNGLLEKIEARKELEERLAEVGSNIEVLQVEKSEVERKLCGLVEQMKLLQEQIEFENSIKLFKEEKLNELESRRSKISEEHLSVSKKTVSL